MNDIYSYNDKNRHILVEKQWNQNDYNDNIDKDEFNQLRNASIDEDCWSSESIDPKNPIVQNLLLKEITNYNDNNYNIVQ